jgi:DNA-directed RNA polymerase subunit D
MDVKVLDQNDRHLKIRIEGISFEMANTIRRAVMGEVPVMAIENVDIIENNSGLVDEVLAHRLGLIPLIWPDSYNVMAKCSCKGRGCSSCTVELSLNAKGPKQVLASDLVSEDKSVQPFDMNDLIVELLDGQRIELVAVAKLGYGNDHAKWQSAVIGYEQKGRAFIFDIESTCGLTVSEVFRRGLSELENRAEEFAKTVKKEL